MWSQAEKDSVVSMLSSHQGIAALDNKDLVVRAFSLPELQMRRSDEGVSISGQVQTDVEARPD